MRTATDMLMLSMSMHSQQEWLDSLQAGRVAGGIVCQTGISNTSMLLQTLSWAKSATLSSVIWQQRESVVSIRQAATACRPCPQRKSCRHTCNGQMLLDFAVQCSSAEGCGQGGRAWGASEGLHGPLQLPVQLPALNGIYGSLQLVHLGQQRLVVVPTLRHLHAHLPPKLLVCL